MKPIVLTIILLIAGFSSKAQTLNDYLYNAVIGKDTLQVEKLLDSGGDANYIKKAGEAEMPLLTISVVNGDFTTVKLLLKHRADANKKDWFNTSPLMYAAKAGNLMVIKLLLNYGADINAQDGQGNTVLSAAKEGKNTEVITFIESLLNKK